MLHLIKNSVLFSKKISQYQPKLFFDLLLRTTGSLSSINNFQVSHKRPGLLPLFKDHETEFMNYFPEAVHSITNSYNFSEMTDVLQRLINLLEYNVPTGDNIRGITTVISYKLLEKPENVTKENVGLANILGWCAELLKASSDVAEDIVNDSDTRRGALCWFKLPGIDSNASLDIFTLECCIYSILKKHFSKHPFYVSIMEFFHDLMYKNTAGNILNSQKLRIGQISMEMFNKITEYKTSCNSYYVGVTLGMYLSKSYDTELRKQVTPILMRMGRYLQIQSEMQDLFGDTHAMGNLGKDIGRGKCTLSIAVALQKADPSQRKVIEDNYGKPEQTAIETIKKLYQSLDIATEFSVYEEESYEELSTSIDKLSDVPLRNLLDLLIKYLYKRK